MILQKALIANANQIWRISSAVIDPETKEAREELRPQEIRKVAKAVESLMETFNGLGIRIIDRLGEPFDAGLPDQVVTEEPREGLTREQIVRTIRPTIVWNATMIQRGEVDIAVPITKQ
jgi:phosphotransacetylase